jgi:hypothetical protein
MERKGVFAANPANVDSRASDGTRLYKGPVLYPKMLYHPEGDERLVSPATIELDRGREIHVPARYELINTIVEDAETEKALLAGGWHTHPAKAIEAGNRRRKAEGTPLRAVPPMSLDLVAQTLSDEVMAKDEEIAKLKAELAKTSGRRN